MEQQTREPGPHAAKPRADTDEYRRQVVDMVTSTGRTAMSVGPNWAKLAKVPAA